MADGPEKLGVIAYSDILDDLPRQSEGSDLVVGYDEEVIAVTETASAPTSIGPAQDVGITDWIKRFDADTLAASKRVLRYDGDAEVTWLRLPVVLMKASAVGSVALARASSRNIVQVFRRDK
ncbi:MAG TPA: hypothetical protein VG992_03500 [Candidatus Saccharimonadales bacterium]|nr:hypothetical protein [Candidatus Saccharimonadales bacterium]